MISRLFIRDHQPADGDNVQIINHQIELFHIILGTLHFLTIFRFYRIELQMIHFERQRALNHLEPGLIKDLCRHPEALLASTEGIAFGQIN